MGVAGEDDFHVLLAHDLPQPLVAAEHLKIRRRAEDLPRGDNGMVHRQKDQLAVGLGLADLPHQPLEALVKQAAVGAAVAVVVQCDQSHAVIQLQAVGAAFGIHAVALVRAEIRIQPRQFRLAHRLRGLGAVKRIAGGGKEVLIVAHTAVIVGGGGNEHALARVGEHAQLFDKIFVAQFIAAVHKVAGDQHRVRFVIRKDNVEKAAQDLNRRHQRDLVPRLAPPEGAAARLEGAL